jgi:hypothetical protein
MRVFLSKNFVLSLSSTCAIVERQIEHLKLQTFRPVASFALSITTKQDLFLFG